MNVTILWYSLSTRLTAFTGYLYVTYLVVYLLYTYLPWLSWCIFLAGLITSSWFLFFNKILKELLAVLDWGHITVPVVGCKPWNHQTGQYTIWPQSAVTYLDLCISIKQFLPNPCAINLNINSLASIMLRLSNIFLSLLSYLQGYNRLIVFSRPFYFCLCCGLLKFLDYTIHHASSTSFIIYGFPFTATASLTFAKSLMKGKSAFISIVRAARVYVCVCMRAWENIHTHKVCQATVYRINTK